MGDPIQYHNLMGYLLALFDHENVSFDPNSQNAELAHEIKGFLDEIPGGFLIYKADETETIIYANQALIDILGCDSVEDFKAYTHNSFRGIVHPDDIDAIEASIVRQISESRMQLDYVEYRIRSKDGSIHWVEDYGHFMHNNVLGDIFYVFITDATDKIERQKAEKAALARQKIKRDKQIENMIEEYDNERKIINQEHLRRLKVIEALSYNYESILYVDLNTNLVIPYRVSVRTAKQFDTDLNERGYRSFVSEYVRMWVHPEDKKAVARNFAPDTIRKRLGEHGTYYQNYRCIVGDEVQHIQLRISSVGNRLSQIVVGFRRVDEELRREMRQKQLLKTALEQAKQAAEAKDIFLSNVSHDMRTPLNAIFGFTELAKKKPDDKTAVLSYLDKIETASRQLLEITEKVLTVTYTGSDGASINETECDLCAIVAEVYKSLQKKAARKRILFTQNTSAPYSDVFADAEKLKQILMQLTDNAIKYTKAGGSVELKLIETRSRSNGYCEYEFIISDTGIGISEGALPHIFDPFEREFNSTSSGVFGAGLGLTIAKNFTEMMGGKIDVKSEVGVGSTFKVTLGFRAINKASDLPDMQEIFADIKNKKILIVEDNEINLEIETEMLEDLGFSIESAANGRIAVDMVNACPDDYYAVILMDIQMPVMDGLRATEAIRRLKKPSATTIPIIALSANAFESDKHLSAKAGMDAHLSKPIDIDELLRTIANIVNAKKTKALIG